MTTKNIRAALEMIDLDHPNAPLEAAHVVRRARAELETIERVAKSIAQDEGPSFIERHEATELMLSIAKDAK